MGQNGRSPVMAALAAGLASLPMLAPVLGILAIRVVGSANAAGAAKSAAPVPDRPAAVARAADGPEPQGIEPALRAPRTMCQRLGLADDVPIDDPRVRPLMERAEQLLVAVPDPIDARGRRSFDDIVSAVRAGAAHADYLLDRHWLPWEADAAVAENKRGPAAGQRRVVPGELLFRRNSQGREQLLLVQLVGETLEWGVHPVALRTALERASWRADPAQVRPAIRIVGPSYSGSRESLRRALAEFANAHDGTTTVRIISGSATSDDNLRALTIDTPKLNCRFSATVLPDGATRDALFGIGAFHALRIVMLYEFDSAFGRDFVRPEGGDAPGTAEGGFALSIPYPLHIANVRGEHERSDRRDRGAEKAAAAVQRVLDLAASEEVRESESIPVFSNQTVVVDDLALTHVMGAIAEEIPALGRDVGVLIFGTDINDKLFLAQQVRHYAPDATLFFLEKDLLFAHPSLSTDLDGSFVLSSYPPSIDARRVTWSFLGGENPREFPSDAAEGAFNATIAHLSPGAPLDYGVPAFSDPSGTVRPRLWMSVIGRGRFWPIGAIDVLKRSDRDANRYVETSSPWPAPAGAVPALTINAFQAWFTMALSLLFASAVVAFVAGVRRPFRRGWPRSMAPFTLLVPRIRRSTRIRQMAWIAAMFTANSVGAAVCIGLFWPVLWDAAVGRLVLRPAVPSALFVGALALACVVPLAGAMLAIDRLCVVTGWPRWLRWLVPLLPLLVGWLAAEPLSIFGVFSASRALHAFSGVSPVVPVLCLITGLYVLGFAQLRRMRLLECPGWPDLFVRRNGSDNDLLRCAEHVLDEIDPHLGIATTLPHPLAPQRRVLTRATWHALGAPFVALFISWPVAVRLNSLLLPTRTWIAFGVLFFLLSSMVIFSVARFVSVWCSLRRFLRRLAISPVSSAICPLPDALVWSPIGEMAFSPVGPVLHAESVRLADSMGRRLDVELTEKLTLAAGGPIVAEFPLRAANARTCFDIAMAGRHGGLDTADAWRASSHRHLERCSAAVFDLLSSNEACGDAAQPWLKDAATYFTLRVSEFVRYGFAHLRTHLVASSSGVLLLLLAMTSFPFQPRRLLLLYCWGLIVSIVGVTLWSFIQMDRDAIISQLNGTKAGRVTFNWQFARGVTVFVLVPLLGIASAQFPEIGGALFAWLDPLLRTFK